MANKYFRNTGNTSWNVTTNWSATDGGASVGAIPSSADDVFFTANSGNCVVNALGFVKALNFTGYTNTLTMSYGINVYGNLTFSGSMNVLGDGSIGISILATVPITITSNGKVWPNDFAIGNNSLTITLADTLVIGGSMWHAAAAITWAGSFGWVVKGTFSIFTTGSNTNVLQSNVTYITSGFAANNSVGSSHTLLKSSTTGTKANLIATGNISVANMNFTDIDASGGRTIYTFSGVVSNCNNVVSLIDELVIANSTIADSFIL